MLQAVQLPAGIADLCPSLAHMDGYALTLQGGRGIAQLCYLTRDIPNLIIKKSIAINGVPSQVYMYVSIVTIEM